MIDVLVIGAGPVGLACAIEAKRAGLSTVVVEKGALVNSLLGYPTNMELFSTADRLEIGDHPFASARYKPLREETIDYYRGVARAEGLDLRLYTRVIDLHGTVGSFSGNLRSELDHSTDSIRSRYIVVATGFFDIPNRLDIPGEDLPKVSHYYKEPYAYVDQRIAIVGAKNSAAKAALQCFRNGAQVSLIVRGSEISDRVKYWIRPDLINRIDDGSIATYFDTSVTAIRPDSIELAGPDGSWNLPNDFVLAMTGYRPDYPFLGTIGIETGGDPARTPVYDPDSQQTNRAGIYLAGTVCGGLRTGLWFIDNGRAHAKTIAGHISSRS